MSSEPTLTIGLPVFNGARYLQETLESVLSQSFTDFEVVISDNASTDETEAIGRAAAARDLRVTYRRNAENVGLSWQPQPARPARAWTAIQMGGGRRHPPAGLPRTLRRGHRC